MKFYTTVRDVLLRACAYFTVITLILYSIGMLINDSGSFSVPKLSMLLCILLFCIAVSAAGSLIKNKRLPVAAAYLLHFTVVTAAFYTVFVFISGVNKNGTTVIIATVCYVILYVSIMGAGALIRYAADKKNSGKSEYTAQFEKLKDDKD